MQKYPLQKPAYFGIMVLFLVILFATSGCTTTDGTGDREGMVVAVTIPPQAEMVREIGGDLVDVFVMMPPGSDPHTYEPGPALVERAARADLYITLGTGLFPIEDSLVLRLKAVSPDLIVVDSSKGIILLRDHNEIDNRDRSSDSEYLKPESLSGESPDPHIWLSLRNAVIMSENTRDAMIDADPDHEKEYRENCERYTARLRDLDQSINDTFSRNNPGIILVTHPAWEYFARDYHLEMVAIEKNGKEPTAKDIETLITLARSRDIRVVFSEAQESSRQAETIAREIGGTVRVIDPLAADYLANLERVAGAFREAGSG
jgi:zinc transport system substrate-binding protein